MSRIWKPFCVSAAWRCAMLSCAMLSCVLLLAPTVALAQYGATNGEWRSYGGDIGSTKYSPLDQINAGNFDDLQVAWRWQSVDALLDLETLREDHDAKLSLILRRLAVASRYLHRPRVTCLV